MKGCSDCGTCGVGVSIGLETVAKMGMGQYNNKVKREIKAWKVEIERDRIKMIISKGKGRVGGG